MTDEPQKVSKCRYCSQEITWHKDAVTGKNYPKNLNGSAHLCRSKTPQPDSEEKRRAAGFDLPAGEQKKEDCTSTLSAPATTPANSTGLKIVEGQITFLDHAAHKLIVKDRRGETTTFIWAPPFNDQMQKLKQWFFIRATGEHEPDFGLYRLTAQEYFKRPDDWPAPNHSGGSPGGRTFQPRNEKPIIMQVIFKEACETARQQMKMSEKFDAEEADAAWEWAVAKTEATMDRLCKVGGVQ